MKFDRVHTVWDYNEGPRSGVADYMGKPHFYRNEFDKEKDVYTETFLLKPIDHETFQLVVEQWDIRRKWELALHRGEVADSSHTAMLSQNARYAELNTKIESRIDAISSEPIAVRADFRVRVVQPELPNLVFRELEVLWLPCNPITIDLNELKRRLPELDLSPIQETIAYFLLDGLTITYIAVFTNISEQAVNNHMAAIGQALGPPPSSAAATVTPPKSPRPSPLKAALDPNEIK